MDLEGQDLGKEEIPGSGQSMYGYVPDIYQAPKQDHLSALGF